MLHDRSTNGGTPSWRLLLLGVSLVLAAAATAAAQGGAAATPPAQDGAVGAASQNLPTTNQYQGEYFTSDLTEVFRLRHMEGRGQGDVPSFTNFGFTKFVWDERGVLMFDIGARLTNDAEPGFSCGAHRRAVFSDVLLGAGLFYDHQHHDENFHQISLAGELFFRNWGFRTNGYYVLGDDVESDTDYETTGATTLRFEGNNLLADNLLLKEEFDVAMSGFDVELARWLDSIALEWFVGGYYYEGEIGGDTIGAKGGVRGFLVPDLAAGLTVSGDDLFGTNVFAGVTWFVGARGGLSRPHMARRLVAPIQRNEQIVVNELVDTTLVPGPVVLTYEDDPIEIVHVRAGAVGLDDGTFENPFSALPATQEADIVYVHADGVFAGQSYRLAADQRFLGEGSGNLHFVDTNELDEVILPAGSGGVNRPVIDAAPGNAITLSGEGNEVSNFTITDSAGHAIFGDGVNDFDINRNVIDRPGGRGIFLNNVTGDIETNFIASGRIADNVVTNSVEQNIQVILASDFHGEVAGNTANGSMNAQGISISGPFLFNGDVSDNIANNNALEGILVDVDAFFGEIESNTATMNDTTGMLLTLGFGEVDIVGNTTNANMEKGIELSITGDYFSDVDLFANTANNNGEEGMSLTFDGTGTSIVQVLGNSFAGNNVGVGGPGREFVAEVEDVFESSPTAYIELNGNTSANVLGTGPPFNYEFANSDLFSDGRMIVEVGTNVGTVGLEEGVEQGEAP